MAQARPPEHDADQLRPAVVERGPRPVRRLKGWLIETFYDEN